VTPAPARRERWGRAAFGAAVLVQLVVLYWPRHVSQGGIPYLDKVVHITIFALVAATGLRFRVPRLWLVGLLAAHAVVSELIQHWLLANRSGDPTDTAADLVGVALGVVIGLRLAVATGVETTGSGGSLTS
jgi:hypothetical protein